MAPPKKAAPKNSEPKPTASNLERYKADLAKLVRRGELLLAAMYQETLPDQFEKTYKKALGEKYDAFVKALPGFKQVYQRWYSESCALIKQLLPDRLQDFVRHYEKPKARKDITWTNYVIEDYLQGLRVTRGYQKEVVVDSQAAIPQFEQQRAILHAAQGRFESSLFEIRQLVQADLLDSELDAARMLQKNKFYRAAGAIAGVVIEKHLGEVCVNHQIIVSKKNPTIGDLNDLLKNSSVFDAPRWRSIQYLADLRNLCVHNKDKEPVNDQIDDLITGAEKLVKTLF
jgi:hypothetical protein